MTSPEEKREKSVRGEKDFTFAIRSSSSEAVTKTQSLSEPLTAYEIVRSSLFSSVFVNESDMTWSGIERMRGGCPSRFRKKCACGQCALRPHSQGKKGRRACRFR